MLRFWSLCTNYPPLSTLHAFSQASCHILLCVHAAVLFCLFVFKIVSSHTLCILLYSAPLSLHATDGTNGNTNGGRNNVLSSTVSRPMPHSTSPSPACAAGDQGKENSALCFVFFLSCNGYWTWNSGFGFSSHHTVSAVQSLDPFVFWWWKHCSF